MDWSPTGDGAGTEEEEEEGSLMPPSAVEQQELPELSFSLMNSSGRRLGRKISHKKSASDTFAFAAGHDFLALLADRPPLEPMGHARHASSGAGVAEASAAETDQQMALGVKLEGGSAFGQAADGSSLSNQHAADGSPSRAGPNSRSDPGTASPAVGLAAAAAAGRSAAAMDAAAASDTAEAAVEAADAAGGSGTQTRSNALDTTQLDPRKAKRILANRQSAQRSRMKRLQYINELEARQDKAESALRDLRSKVDKTQRGQAGLAREVEQQHTELSTLQQQLLHEQSVQANLTSYVQALQLQMHQQQQHWGCGQHVNGSQVPITAAGAYGQQEAAQAAAGYSQLQSGSAAYDYSASAAQYGAQQYALQPDGHLQQQPPSCNGMPGDLAAAAYVQQQQQWAAYDPAQCSTQHQQQQHQQHQQHQQQQQQAYLQQHGHSYSYSHMQQTATSQQQQRHHQQQQQQHGLLQPAADVASAAAAATGGAAYSHMHRHSLSGGGGHSPHGSSGGGSTAAAAAAAASQIQQQQQQLLPAGGTLPGHATTFTAAAAAAALGAGHVSGCSGSILAAAAAAAAAAHPSHQQHLSTATLTLPGGPQALPGVVVEAGPGEGLAARRASLSQGSGSVLLHGSVSDADLDSLLGLGSPLQPADPLEPAGSRDIRSLLSSGDSGLVMAPDELLLRGLSGSAVKSEAHF